MKGKPPIVVRLVIVAAAWAAIGTLLFFVQRDLERRPDAGIRGRKEVWRRATMLPPGAIAYLLFGRRR
jgi:hypothetical protein